MYARMEVTSLFTVRARKMVKTKIDLFKLCGEQFRDKQLIVHENEREWSGTGLTQTKLGQPSH